MKYGFFAQITLATILLSGWLAPLYGQDRGAEEQAIREKIASYLRAYDQRDAAAMAAHWSPDAEYVSPLDGTKIKGRDNLKTTFEQVMAASDRVELDVTITSIRFLTDDVALEEGVARTVRPNEAPTRSTYTAIHVKRNGDWYIESLRETNLPTPSSGYEHLKSLEWMIGEWVDKDENGTITTRCQWTRNKNFMTRSFSVSVEDRIEMEGTQVIGWDAARQKIRTWVFDSDGGFSEGTITQHDNRWTLHSHGTFPDGRTGSTVTLLTKIDDDTVVWESLNREIDGELLPNIDPVIVVRKGTRETARQSK